MMNGRRPFPDALGVPTRTLPDDDRRRITEAIRAADHGRFRHRWRSCTIPAWQAVAACLAVCMITWSAARVAKPLSGLWKVTRSMLPLRDSVLGLVAGM